MGIAFSEVEIVLVRPKKPENLGSVARLIRNFSFSKLILVNPEVDIDNERANVTARHAQDVLYTASIVENLSSALEKSNLIIGTTARTGGDYNLKRIAIIPEELNLPENPGKISIIFGPEDDGLSNEEIKKCNLVITLPTGDDWPALNLSHAAAIIMYFISQKLNKREETKHRPALPVEREILLSEFSKIIEKCSFNKPEQAIQAFKNVLGRGYVTGRETHTLIGVMKEISSISDK